MRTRRLSQQRTAAFVASVCFCWCKLLLQSAFVGANEEPTMSGWHRSHCHRPVALLLFAQENHDRDALLPGDDIPEEFLENAKRIGKEALKVTQNGMGTD